MVFQLRFRGDVASAGWTTRPPEPTLGDSCAGTVIFAYDATTRENTDQPSDGHLIHNSGDRVVLQRFWYETVEEGEGPRPKLLKESFGGTDDAMVEIPYQLTSGVASASVPMSTYDFETQELTSGTDSVSVQ